MQRLYSKPLVPNQTVNISIVGMNGSGKSAVLVKYLTRRFICEYAPYLTNCYTKCDSIDGQELTLNIQDTSDSDELDIEEIYKWSQVIVILFSITSRRSFYRAQEIIESLRQCSEYSEARRSQASSPTRPKSSPQSSSSLVPTISGSNLTPPNSSVLPPSGSTLSVAPPSYATSLRQSAMNAINVTRPPNMLLVANKADLARFRLVERHEAEDFSKVHAIPYMETTAAETYRKVQSIFHSAVRLTSGRKPGRLHGPGGNRLTLGSPGFGTNGSILSSLAVTPGLLLQRKPSPLPTPLPATCKTPTSGPSEVGLKASIEQDKKPNEDPAQSTTLTSPQSILSNIRFRGTSPSAAKTTSVNLLGTNKTPPTRASPSRSQTVTMSALLAKQAPSTDLGSKSETLPRRMAALTPSKQQKMTLQPTASAANSTKDTTKQNKVSAKSKTSTNPASSTTQPQKKNPINFRFFSKKSK